MSKFRTQRFGVQKPAGGMSRFFSPANLDRYRKLASGAIGEAEQHQLLQDLVEEMDAFRRDARAAAVDRRSAFQKSVGITNRWLDMNSRHGYARANDETKAEQRPPIVLTTADRDKLLALIRELPMSARSRASEFLREEVERADVSTDDVAPSSVVRMGSVVKFIDHDDGRVHRIKLVFPEEARGIRSISVLSSIGSALIGLGPGQSICWSDPGGQRDLTVLEVSGDACIPSPRRRRA